MSGNSALNANALRANAERAVDGVAPGLSLSMGYLTSHNQELAAAHLLSAWRRAAPGRIEYTLPFECIIVALESGRLLARKPIRAKELGIYPGRVLPNELDEYLPSSVPDERHAAYDFVVENSVAVWQLFGESRPLQPAERELVRAFQKARNAGLLVQEHVFQEALHAGFTKWLIETEMGA